MLAGGRQGGKNSGKARRAEIAVDQADEEAINFSESVIQPNRRSITSSDAS
jgi:hypothetical protein